LDSGTDFFITTSKSAPRPTEPSVQWVPEKVAPEEEWSHMQMKKKKKFWEELSPTFLDTTRTVWKTTRQTVIILLIVYSLTL
jgi:hypothetical protein